MLWTTITTTTTTKRQKKNVMEFSWVSMLRTPLVSTRMQLIPGLAQWVKDLVWLWLWCRPSAAAPIRPLAWERPSVLKSKKKKKRICLQRLGSQLWLRSDPRGVHMPQVWPLKKKQQPIREMEGCGDGGKA